MMVTVKNRDLGEITVHSITYQPPSDTTLIMFKSEAGDLIASLCAESLVVTDPAYPGLKYNAERFRPLLMEALKKWNA